MARKRLGYVELEWTCPHCNHRNPGTSTVCQSCGAPQPEDVQFQQPAQETLMAEADQVPAATAGPDVHCPFCGTRNPAGSAVCSRCGGDLAEGSARSRGRVLGAHRSEPAPEVTCPACGSPNPATATRCSQCNASLARPAPSLSPAARPQAAASRRSNTWLFVAAGILLVGCLGLFFMLTRTDEIVGEVQGVEWSRQISVQALVAVERQDWQDEIPADGDVESCQDRVRRTQDDPAPGAVEVCGTPYTVDEGTGLGQVVQDCVYEVSEPYCRYTVNEWQSVDTIAAEGADFNPRWPELSLGGQQRAGERVETYRCIFQTDGRAYTYTTNDEATYRLCQPGTRWILSVNSFNAVTDIEPEP